jgi:hypothetical protein
MAECALRRHPSEVRAVCGNSACTDPCGGCRATGIPTATGGAQRNSRTAEQQNSRTAEQQNSRTAEQQLLSHSFLFFFLFFFSFFLFFVSFSLFLFRFFSFFSFFSFFLPFSVVAARNELKTMRNYLGFADA